jgi:hypothetical protein
MANQARDYLDRYFSEKLWALIPAAFREEDGLAKPPGYLRAFIEVLARHAAHLRRSTDRLWDDEFIELCSEWAVPYIGELVATRLVSALNRPARRVDVAKTIYYRRRKGTPRILEELIADIARWEGKVVEEFRRLGRMRHGLDPKPLSLEGRFTHTPPGGWADVRRPRGAELAGGPFDEFHYTPDGRRPRGRDGRYGIAKLTFHLYRLASTRLDDVTPAAGPGAKTFTFDPSGRDIPLFIRRHRTDDRERFNWEDWLSALEWELPGPIRCRILGHAEFVITDAVLARLQVLLVAPGGLTPAQAATAIASIRRFRAGHFPDEDRLRTILSTIAPAHFAALQVPAVWDAFLAEAMVRDCGKRALLPPGGVDPDVGDSSVHISVAAGVALRERIAAGNLSGAVLVAPGREWVIDPVRGRFRFLGAGAAPPALVGYHYGFSGPIGAGGHDRSDSVETTPTQLIQSGGAIQSALAANPNFLPPGGVAEITDSLTYSPVANRSGISVLQFRAGNFQRPYLRLTHDWRFDTAAGIEGDLTLDGLWVGAGSVSRSVVLQGDFQTVTLRNMTLDPGGVSAAGPAIAPVPLRITGSIDRLFIDHSIMGPIIVEAGASVEKIEIQDSIVHGPARVLPPGPIALAISSLVGETRILRTTVFGDVDLPWLYASDTLIAGYADVTNTQEGCFRFSAVLRNRDPLDPLSAPTRVPHPYESHFLTGVSAIFVSAIFGQPAYAQLAESAPEFLRRGAENGAEIGAFSSLLNPIKFDSLRAKVDEFAPFGLLPIYHFET